MDNPKNYWEEATWVPLEPYLEYWCKNKEQRTGLRHATIDKCMAGEISCKRIDGYNFTSPEVYAEHGKLLIYRKEFDEWASDTRSLEQKKLDSIEGLLWTSRNVKWLSFDLILHEWARYDPYSLIESKKLVISYACNASEIKFELDESVSEEQKKLWDGSIYSFTPSCYNIEGASFAAWYEKKGKTLDIKDFRPVKLPVKGYSEGPSNDDLHPKERTSLYKMVLGLAKDPKYRTGPNDDRISVTKVCNALDLNKMSVDRKTVATHIKAATDALDDGN